MWRDAVRVGQRSLSFSSTVGALHFVAELAPSTLIEVCLICALQDILFILGANLARIEERWDSGRLRASGLSSQHVGSLVSFKHLPEDGHPERAFCSAGAGCLAGQ